MRIVLPATLSLAAVLALAAQPNVTRAAIGAGAGQDSTKLASRLLGSWTGQATLASSATSQPLQMTWKKAADGRLIGTVTLTGGPAHQVNIVWSSDTAFIYESEPYENAMLHQRVVTRSLVHFKSHMLEGTFEARPTTYNGKTMNGKFSVTRAS